MKLRRYLLVGILSLMVLATGCATTRDSMLLGAGIGAGAGSAVGYTAGGNNLGGTLIGTASGAVLGGLIGLLIHKGNGGSSEPVASQPPSKTLPPFVTKPEVRSIWIPDKIEDDGRRYEEGHRVFLIEKQSTFSQ